MLGKVQEPYRKEFKWCCKLLTLETNAVFTQSLKQPHNIGTAIIIYSSGT